MGQRCSLIGIDPQYLKIALKPDCSMWRQPSCNLEGAVKTIKPAEQRGISFEINGSGLNRREPAMPMKAFVNVVGRRA